MPPTINVPFVLSVFGTFVATSVVAYTYVWPALRNLPRFEALRLLAALHAFRFFGMNFLVVGFVSLGINPDFASEVGLGDLIAAILALLAMAGLSWRWSIAIPLVWIFNVWGTLDLLNAYYLGVTKNGDPGLMAAALYVPAVYVPLLLVNHVLAFMILSKTRSGEGVVSAN